MSKKSPFVCSMCAMPCGIVCAIKSLIYKACAVCAASPSTCAGAHPCAHMHTPAHACSRIHTAHSAHTAHANTHAGLRVFACRTTPPTYRTKKMMDCKNSVRVIACTPENAPQMLEVVKSWPELHHLVKGLQAQNQFPGLRALKITLTGPQSIVAQGLGALLPENGSKPV